MGHTLLLAEDDDDLREMLALALRSNGYEVIEACDEREGWAVLDREPHIDLLVTDVEMPGDRDGIDLARRAQSLDSTIAIIVMSGRALDDIDLPSTAGFMAKPFAVGGFLRYVDATLRLSQAISEELHSEKGRNVDITMAHRSDLLDDK
jgi:DNA-binding response OmpR family regulator